MQMGILSLTHRPTYSCGWHDCASAQFHGLWSRVLDVVGNGEKLSISWVVGLTYLATHGCSLVTSKVHLKSISCGTSSQATQYNSMVSYEGKGSETAYGKVEARAWFFSDFPFHAFSVQYSISCKKSMSKTPRHSNTHKGCLLIWRSQEERDW